MGQPCTSQDSFPLEDSMPQGAASLESILCTEELQRRPFRAPDYEKENRALVTLAGAMADPRANILQTFADTILEVTDCDSSGLSLLTKDGGKRFYWPAIAGQWSPHVGGGTPRNFGPCGDVLDRDCTLLFRHFERRYPYLLPVSPAAEECLLVPFYVDGKAVGTIWAIMHSGRRKFDSEDDRLMSVLGKFASLAYQTVESIQDLKAQVAAREKAEAALRKRASGLEAQIHRLVDANIMGIFFWNFGGKIVEANDAFLRIAGYGREELVSGSVRWTDLTPPEWRALDERAIADLKETAEAQPYEKEFFRKDGTRVPVLIGSTLLEKNANEGVAFVVDLTEQKYAEEAFRNAQEELRNTQSQLAHANRVMTMGELAASVAHEVKQPLAAIVASGDSCTAWLENNPPNVEKALAAARRVIQAATQANDTVEHIRALFKKATSQPAPFDVNELVEKTVSLVNHEAQRKNIALSAELGAEIPAVTGDRVQLQQVILNLLMNSLESLNEVDSGPRRILVRTARSSGGEIVTSVEDTGPGVDPRHAERLFAPFFTTKPQGIGMGLSISRSIIEAHGGRLWAVKNQPRGAAFHFSLPPGTGVS